MRLSRHTLYFLLLLLCCHAACDDPRHDVTRGVYYWKTIYRPTAYEQERLREASVSDMYIRFFDIDWDEGANTTIPIAPVQLPTAMDTATRYVPVVFITQHALTKLRPSDIAPLAGNISRLVSALCAGAGIKPAELQVDCDWTAGNKTAYFSLLKALREQPFFKSKLLSCTIRMHQVKYTTSSGIPPVDKGLLMCYSMGDLKKPGPRNSILEADEAKEYLNRIKVYPLALDVALPLFQWCVQFREKQFRGILREATPGDVKESKLFEHVDKNLYRCRKDTMWLGYGMKAGDEIRVEAPSYETIKEVAEYTSKRITRPAMKVLLFSCDSITLSKYSAHELESIYNTYR